VRHVSLGKRWWTRWRMRNKDHAKKWEEVEDEE